MLTYQPLHDAINQANAQVEAAQKQVEILKSIFDRWPSKVTEIKRIACVSPGKNPFISMELASGISELLKAFPPDPDLYLNQSSTVGFSTKPGEHGKNTAVYPVYISGKNLHHTQKEEAFIVRWVSQGLPIWATVPLELFGGVTDMVVSIYSQEVFNSRTRSMEKPTVPCARLPESFGSHMIKMAGGEAYYYWPLENADLAEEFFSNK